MRDFTSLASTATSQYGVLTKQQLNQGGYREHNIQYLVKAGKLIRVHSQVYVVAGTARVRNQRICAAALAAAEHLRIEGGQIGAASLGSSALLYGFRSAGDCVDVTVRYPRKLSVPGARVVRSRDLELGDITWVDGIPTTTPERTICDLGLKFPEPEVMRILRHSVAKGLVNRRDVRRMRIRIGKQGRDGAGITGRCLDQLPALAEMTESGLEVMFLEVCDAYGIPRPIVQLPVLANGRAYRLDFAYPTERVFIEVDGRGHGLQSQISKDGGRQNDLVAHGWRPLRLDYGQLKSDPGYCAQIVLDALNSVTLEPDYLPNQGHRRLA